MKTPFQKNCQTHHEVWQPCPAGICFLPRGSQDSGRPTDKAKAREPVDDMAGEVGVVLLPASIAPPPLKASRGGKRVVEPAAPLAVYESEVQKLADRTGMIIIDEASDGPMEVYKPLTPAEKQKAYRERNPEEKREANKLRMRKKRDG